MDSNSKNDFNVIMKYAHCGNWLPDWQIAYEVYDNFSSSYSVLTPFAYSYFEEIIRSSTPEYDSGLQDEYGEPIPKKVSWKLIELAIEENVDNKKYTTLLQEMKRYFCKAAPQYKGENRHNVLHAFIPPISWDKETFEKLIHDIALLSKCLNSRIK